MKSRLNTENAPNENAQEEQRDKYFRIDWQGYNTDNPTVSEERVDVSPAGTEGIFIDPESYPYGSSQE